MAGGIPKSILASLTRKQVEEVLDPWKRVEKAYKRHRKFFLAVERLFAHEVSGCKECSHGPSGHCETHEKLWTCVRDLLRKEGKHYGRRSKKTVKA